MDSDDPAKAIVDSLIAKYPSVDAKLFSGRPDTESLQYYCSIIFSFCLRRQAHWDQSEN